MHSKSAEELTVVREAQDFFDKYTRAPLMLCKLSAIYNVLAAVQKLTGDLNYNPKRAFEIMYKEFGNSLFSQYTLSETTPPTAQQLQQTAVRSQAPAAHYFIASPELWKYGLELLPISAADANSKGHTALMAAVMGQKVDTVAAMLESVRSSEERFKLVARTTYMGDTVMHMIVSQINIVNNVDYLKMARAILSHFSHHELALLLEIQDHFSATPLQSIAKRLLDRPEDYLISLRDLLLGFVGIGRNRRRLF
ncbi:MAG: hypothetical protein JSS50_00995 [Proteobacteria bacterium]|nr:hypothetical protein [Pseudomonadota bacterium]